MAKRRRPESPEGGNSSSLASFRIVESAAMTQAGPPQEVRRTWRERLLGRPWNPWQATRLVPTQVPRRDIARVGNNLVMHPSVAAALRERLEQESAD